MSSKSLPFRLTAISLAIVMVHLSAAHNRCAIPASRKTIFVGELTTRGSTQVDGLRAISGQTLFSGSLIETSDQATSVVSLGAGLRIELQMNSRARLSFDDSNISSALDIGALRISVRAGINASVKTNDGVVIADRTQTTVFSVEFKDGQTVVTVLMGRVELQAQGRTQQVEAGQFTDSVNQRQPQSSGKKEFSGRKLAAILLPLGGALAIAAFVFANGNDDSNNDFGGCVQVSGMTDSRCF